MGIAGDFVLIVLAGLCGGLLARALRLPLLVGYIVAGILIGPNTPGPQVGQIRDIELLAEIGVALLLFSVGLEVSFRDLILVRRVAIFGGALQVGLTAGGVAILLPSFTRVGTVEAVWVGCMFALSSTMVVLKVISASNMTRTLASRVMIGMLVIQDLAVIPMFIVLPRLGSGVAGSEVALALAQSALLIAGVYFVGRKLLPPVLHRIHAWGPNELFLLSILSIGVGLGAAAHAAGLSFALGAMIAGLVLSETDFQHQALSDLVPLRDVFGLLFFVSVGMLFDPGYLRHHVGVVLEVLAAVVAGKTVLIGWLSRLFGYRKHAPWIVGFGLSQVGEFSFVLARTGQASGAIAKDTYDLVLTVTVLSMALSPLLSKIGFSLGSVWRRWREGPSFV
jgi:monovalent cation:H+ antiporter-2, CPA2 family